MSASARRLVLLGMMAKTPVPGVVWQTLHYLVGFRRLGFDPYYVETHGRTPSMLMESDSDDFSGRAAGFIEEVMRRFDMGDRWAYHALHDNARCFGLSDTRLRDLYTEAELIINLHGGTQPHAGLCATERLVYLETDPVRLQIELHDGVLYVRTKDAAWQREVERSAALIRSRLDGLLGDRVVRRIVVAKL